MIGEVVVGNSEVSELGTHLRRRPGGPIPPGAARRRQSLDVYKDEIALVEHVEPLGFDTVLADRTSLAVDGYSPSIVPIAAAIAARIRRIRRICRICRIRIGFNLLLLLLPLLLLLLHHHRVALAEATATLDVLSTGRIDVGPIGERAVLLRSVVQGATPRTCTSQKQELTVPIPRSYPAPP